MVFTGGVGPEVLKLSCVCGGGGACGGGKDSGGVGPATEGGLLFRRKCLFWTRTLPFWVLTVSSIWPYSSNHAINVPEFLYGVLQGNTDANLQVREVMSLLVLG